MREYDHDWKDPSRPLAWVRFGTKGPLLERKIVGRYLDGTLVAANSERGVARRVVEAYELDEEEAAAARAEAEKFEKKIAKEQEKEGSLAAKKTPRSEERKENDDA